jgi:thioredoxin 1
MKAQFDTIIQSDTAVLVDFFAEWCAPCKAQSPILKEIAQEFGERIKVIKIDVDKNPEIAQRYKIQGVPTIMLFKKGDLKFKQAGMMSKPQLLNIVMQNA